jgi:two-component system chemotaxis response regulator CheB
MASTFTRQGAEVTLRALSLGAADYAPKPEAGRVAGAEAYRRELLDKLVALGSPTRHTIARTTAPSRPKPARSNIRPSAPTAPPKLVAIGSSTGGPQALREIISALPRDIRVPIVIAQHMPKLFTAILAEHLTKCGIPASEAQHGETIKAGHIYVAPGDYHMTLKRSGSDLVANLDQSPPVNFCRPAVDPLFDSCANVCGASVLAMILTGMGQDGRSGAQSIRNAGGQVLAQDQQSSVVWGMPGAVVEADLANEILSLQDIGPAVSRRLKGQL